MMTQKFSLCLHSAGALVSQTIARRMNKHNFYDALLEQDHHASNHVRPRAICKAGNSFLVSAIANFLARYHLPA